MSESSLAEVCQLTAQGSCLTNKKENESRHSVTMVKLAYAYKELIFTILEKAMSGIRFPNVMRMKEL